MNTQHTFNEINYLNIIMQTILNKLSDCCRFKNCHIMRAKSFKLFMSNIYTDFMNFNILKH